MQCWFWFFSKIFSQHDICIIFPWVYHLGVVHLIGYQPFLFYIQYMKRETSPHVHLVFYHHQPSNISYSFLTLVFSKWKLPSLASIHIFPISSYLTAAHTQPKFLHVTIPRQRTIFVTLDDGVESVLHSPQKNTFIPDEAPRKPLRARQRHCVTSPLTAQSLYLQSTRTASSNFLSSHFHRQSYIYPQTPLQRAISEQPTREAAS